MNYVYKFFFDEDSPRILTWKQYEYDYNYRLLDYSQTDVSYSLVPYLWEKRETYVPGKRYNGLVEYKFNVEQSDPSTQNNNFHYFTPDLSLFIPTGIHTLDEVKNFSEKETETYSKHYKESYDIVKNVYNTILDPNLVIINESDETVAAVMYAIIGGVLFLYGIIHMIYWGCISEDFGLSEELETDESDIGSINDSDNL
ncbi:hypothetical protein TVAG_129660 [Trichomonas vaginalis G3]|uniref:Uncharacterized protein n=1 Tax=Trichomonas vaginalis (strain ATCC PRA-98 / G3) TaxID=412133 RepID=A2DI62_TRIV3|nr:hypothetical protein TVAGG3_0712500 [Trichomonas vaginalis G3]EAY19858.1 hypothetical protein TVAG_129660 [Trichomonas vaginalis G3]KAI5510013.1 hypothetical protein TVAGG3_0712500 [Trichomonas vaginalis G3]|eukprot:XP_001580844.1 hypothetical protein [Trichomonas vaginalis G3]